MARPTTLRGSKLLLKLGDGASPETFVAPNALTTKSFQSLCRDERIQCRGLR
jgi:hypothetical protein